MNFPHLNDFNKKMHLDKELKPFAKFVQLLGKKITIFGTHMGRMTMLFQQICKWTFRKPFEVKNIYHQMVEIGVYSLSVTSLTSLFTGMVLALQTGMASKNILNEPLYVGTAVGFSMVKELGPVLTSIVIAGRVGAAIAAELGTMNVTEQIDALHTLGTNPVKYLAVPRFLACLLMVPILVLYADLIGVLGGYIVSIYKLGVPSSVYYHDIIDYMTMGDIFHGLIKSVFFAFIIIMVSCYKGFSAQGGAEGVGKATTQTVVISMVLILVSDYFITALLQVIGIG
ncbi:MAG: ABC transporter permease [bacterium]